MSITVINASIRPSNIEGLGLFAGEDISKGDIIGFFDGKIQRYRMEDGVAQIPANTDVQAIDIAVDQGWLYVLEPFDEQLSGVDYINHACSPNCRVDGFLMVVADVDICIGEELTINYSCLTLVKEGKKCLCQPECKYVL